MGTTYFHVVNA